jgi:hypothetical protein
MFFDVGKDFARTPRYGQKTKTLESFPRVCHDPSRWITEVTPRPAAAASMFVCLRRKDVEWKTL